jgi:hypothetical protein
MSSVHANRSKAYIYGHTHTWKVEHDDSGLHLVNLPPVAYAFKDGDPSGWVHAMLEPDGMSLALRCIDPKAQIARPIGRTKVAPGLMRPERPDLKSGNVLRVRPVST